MLNEANAASKLFNTWEKAFSAIVTHAEQKALFVTFRMEVSDSRRLMVMWPSLSIAVQAFRDYREKNKKIETFRF